MFLENPGWGNYCSFSFAALKSNAAELKSLPPPVDWTQDNSDRQSSDETLLTCLEVEDL
jgi:hypothetical protein